jgi:hypothetical protein
MGKSALRQVVSMVVQFKRADDVSAVGCRCNGDPQERPIALHTLLLKRGRPRPQITRAPSLYNAPSPRPHSPTLPLLAFNTLQYVNFENPMKSGDTFFRLWSEERTTACDVWDVKRFEAIVGLDSREA